ncbi:hypothetical protein [Longimicrobium sp.]|uniref:hypothetical protein n=1 Tax=Longimicrobium sp. TaxID=2029185 RepID=UPI002BC16390|nr:hypothetical protein [Longimicrobium sp.]HSU16631.1 hypothetical protein [Longimicrobium sp.]
MLRRIIFLAALLMVPGSFASRVSAQTRVEVVDQSEDPVGRRLVFRVRDALRSSSAFVLVGQEGTRVKLLVDSMDRFKGESETEGVSTMYAVVWTLVYEEGGSTHEEFLDVRIGYAGEHTLADTAEGIVADTDQLIESYRKH